LSEWERIKDLLHQALTLAEGERRRFLDEACASDSALRAEVESLLAADSAAPSHFLRTRAEELEPTELEGAGSLHPGALFERRFTLIRKLGEGGMGQVWLAEQTDPVRRPVALKLIRAGMYDATVLQRFRAERQSLALMDHPCIAKVFEAGTTLQGQPFFVMEFVPGSPITQYCDEHKISIAERIELFIRACEGVQHAHQKAIIHRDLKPANILVVEVDGRPTPRIIDFGLARPVSAHDGETALTQLGQFIGTPGYMSPEQTNPALFDIDTRTDVYALGVILCVLLTGLQPFETRRRERPALYELLRKLREEDPPALSHKVSAEHDSALMVAFARATEPKQLVRQLRGDLDWIASKALDRDRERRYATPSELAADLRRHLRHEPIIARPTSALYRVRKLVRRHRVAALATVLIALLAVATSIAGLIAVRQQHEAQVQRSEAERQTDRAFAAQSRVLTELAAQRLAAADVAGARAILLAVLTDPRLASRRPASAAGVFQDMRAADRLLAVLSGHGARVYAAAFSPDGRRIATVSADKTARLWDAATGAALAVLAGHTDLVYGVAWSPDGTRLVTSSHDRTARVWDTHTGETLLVLSGHADRVCTAAYSPDGARIVTASWDRSARVWDAHTGAQLLELRGHAHVLYSAAFSPDGERIVTASQDKTARIWDARSGAPLASLVGHGDYVADAVYSPDGAHILTASADRTARIWDAHTGSLLNTLAGHGEVVYAAVYSPDGARIVTGSWDRTVRLWNAATGVQIALVGTHDDTVSSAAFSPDGARIVSASRDGTARVWDARASAALLVLAGHRDVLYTAAYSPDARRIVTASQDQSARVWEAPSGAPLLTLEGHSGAVASAHYSPDGAFILTASQDNTLRIWDASSGAARRSLSGHIDRVYDAEYSPDGTQIVSASRDKTARLWDARTGAPLRALSGHSDRVYTAVFSPDGAYLLTASRDKTARVWDARSGATLAVLVGHTDELSSAAYSPDGSHIVTASFDGTARVWDARSHRPMGIVLAHPARVLGAAYAPDGAHIVTAAEDGRVRIFDARDGAQLAALVGHTDRVNAARYAPDGTRIVSASADGTARVWDGRPPPALETQIAWSAAADPDALADIDGAAPSPRRPAPGVDPVALGKRAASLEAQALAETHPERRDALLLEAFGRYTLAEQDARLAHWPEDLLRHWRHRRASLARALARERPMTDVAGAYERARKQAAPAFAAPSPTTE
jgi:eukaryotic-like serine/threonine-protein kinase